MSLTKEQLPQNIIGSLNCSGVVTTGAELDLCLIYYRQVLGNGHYHLPFFLVADLAVLLQKGREVQFRSEKTKKQPGVDESIDRKLVMRYERECLGRILQSADVNTAIEIAATSPDPQPVTKRLLLQIIKSLAPHYPKAQLLNPGLLRDYTLPGATRPEEFDPAEFYPQIEKFLGAINANVNWGNLLFEEDVFELTHLDALGTEHLRVGCRQILEVSRLLRNPGPLQLDLTANEDGVDTAFVDETHYPSGGLAGLTNRGSFENLLTSELVYLDEGTKDVSLFELRYAEGELLYYLRDSGNLRRKRRTVHFVLDVSDIFENKQPGYQWQYSVLLQGICLRLLHDLFEIFAMDALRFHFHYIKSEQETLAERDFLPGEIGVMKTVLSDYVKHGWVSFEITRNIKLDNLVDPKRKSYAIVFSGPAKDCHWSDALAAAEEDEIPLHCVQVSAHSKPDETAVCELPSNGLTVEEITGRKNAILEKLVSSTSSG